jgi:hypothetical protein
MEVVVAWIPKGPQQVHPAQNPLFFLNTELGTCIFFSSRFALSLALEATTRETNKNIRGTHQSSHPHHGCYREHRSGAVYPAVHRRLRMNFFINRLRTMGFVD